MWYFFKCSYFKGCRVAGLLEVSMTVQKVQKKHSTLKHLSTVVHLAGVCEVCETCILFIHPQTLEHSHFTLKHLFTIDFTIF